MRFFWETHVLHQLSWIGLTGKKCAFLHLQNVDLQKVPLSKLTLFSQGKNVLDAPASKTVGFLSRDTCVTSTYWNGLDGTKWTFLHFENSVFRSYFFQYWNIFTQVNNMVDACASNTNGFLSRDTCVSSTQLNRPIWNKLSLSPP
jgi:hypothetical protein